MQITRRSTETAQVGGGLGAGIASSHGEPVATRRMWRGFAPELADVLCIRCTGAGLPMRAHEELVVVLSGSTARMTDPLGRCSVMGPGDVGIVRPGELSRIDAPADGGELRVLLVAAEMLPEGVLPSPSAGPRYGEVAGGRCPVVHDPGLAAQLHALFAELGRGLTALDAVARFRATVAELAARHLPTTASMDSRQRIHPGAARMHAYLREHFARAVSLDTLGAVSRLSRFYLLRVFRHEYGVTPHEYQRHLRVARACRMLARGDSPAATAYAVGFADQSHLTRQLKVVIGTTPGAFARQWTGGVVPVRRNLRSAAPAPRRRRGPALAGVPVFAAVP